MSKIYNISQFAKRINVSASTLRRWDESGEFTAKRRESGHRFYNEEDVRVALQVTPEERRKIVVYCRVSSASQKDDLTSQIEAMEKFCLAGAICVDEWIKEVGGGMNFKRRHFLQLIEQIMRGEVKRVIVAHKDRLARFGFELIQHIAETHGCKVDVANQETLSPQAEMIEDLLSIVHTFSCRLYGMRSYKKAGGKK